LNTSLKFGATIVQSFEFIKNPLVPTFLLFQNFKELPWISVISKVLKKSSTVFMKEPAMSCWSNGQLFDFYKQNSETWLYTRSESLIFWGLMRLWGNSAVNRPGLFLFLITAPNIALNSTMTTTILLNFIGLACQGKEILFRFIMEYSSLRDFGPQVIGLF